MTLPLVAAHRNRQDVDGSVIGDDAGRLCRPQSSAHLVTPPQRPAKETGQAVSAGTLT